MSETTDTEAPAPTPCSPCRGTGTVISGKGGEPHTVPCPWCEGSAVQLPEHDAQAHWRPAATGASADPA